MLKLVSYSYKTLWNKMRSCVYIIQLIISCLSLISSNCIKPIRNASCYAKVNKFIISPKYLPYYYLNCLILTYEFNNYEYVFNDRIEFRNKYSVNLIGQSGTKLIFNTDKVTAFCFANASDICLVSIEIASNRFFWV